MFHLLSLLMCFYCFHYVSIILCISSVHVHVHYVTCALKRSIKCISGVHFQKVQKNSCK